MTVSLHIKVAYHHSVNQYLNKIIKIDGPLAKEKKISEGVHEAGICWESPAKKGSSGAIKILYKGSTVWLPKDCIKVVTVEEKNIFDFTGEKE